MPFCIKCGRPISDGNLCDYCKQELTKKENKKATLFTKKKVLALGVIVIFAWFIGVGMGYSSRISEDKETINTLRNRIDDLERQILDKDVQIQSLLSNITTLTARIKQLERQEKPNEPLLVSDELNDFIFVEGKKEDLTRSISCIDIEEVQIGNDGKNLKVAIKTKEKVPSVGPPFPEGYYFRVDVEADCGGYVWADIIIDNRGWDFFSLTMEGNDTKKVNYIVEGQILTFMFALNMSDWEGEPKIMSVFVQSGYENSKGLRVYDIIPNQIWELGHEEYIDYKLWKS